MLEQLLREPYQHLLVKRLAVNLSKSISPIIITVLAFLCGMIVAPLLAYQLNVAAIFFLLLSGYLDTLDGTVARISNRSSPKGALIDILSDRSVECAVIIGLWFVDPLSRGFLCLSMLSCILLCVTSFLGVAIFTQHDGSKSFYYSPGLIERAEAFIFFVLMILCPTYFSILATTFCIFVLVTTFIRFYEFNN